jgi:hypothetical protein
MKRIKVIERNKINPADNAGNSLHHPKGYNNNENENAIQYK